MLECEAGAGGAGEDQLTPMDGAVVGAAQQDHPIRVVSAAFGFWVRVMHVEKAVVQATSYGATTMMSTNNAAANRRRNRLGGAWS
jgi:hypothetical protein